MSDFSNPKNRFIKWSVGDTLDGAVPDRYHERLADIIEVNVNHAVAEAVSAIEVFPTQEPATVVLRVIGEGPAGEGWRTLSSLDIIEDLMDFENGREAASVLADRFAEIAERLRAYSNPR